MSKKYLSPSGLRTYEGTVKSRLSKKVDKEEGKGLSHNDLTDDLLRKIESFGSGSTSENYDDTEIRALIAELAERIPSISSLTLSIEELNNSKASKIQVINVENSQLTNLTIEPNKYYKIPETTTNINISLSAPQEINIYSEYMFEFVSGNTAPSLTLPNSIKWIQLPTIEVNKTYQCSIVNNIGILVGVANE